eukprot:scaffold143_cov260-Pinguiococcus_pyrenoidosus.AAC.11
MDSMNGRDQKGASVVLREAWWCGPEDDCLWGAHLRLTGGAAQLVAFKMRLKPLKEGGTPGMLSGHARMPLLVQGVRALWKIEDTANTKVTTRLTRYLHASSSSSECGCRSLTSLEKFQIDARSHVELRKVQCQARPTAPPVGPAQKARSDDGRAAPAANRLPALSWQLAGAAASRWAARVRASRVFETCEVLACR